MIITDKIHFVRVVKYTWKAKIVLFFICVVSYVVYNLLLIRILDISGVVPSVIGTALAFFIGFKNNQAYDRWWEARKVWGALVNDSRSWARGILNYLIPAEGESTEEVQERLVRRHIAFVYVLKEWLRQSDTKYYRKYLSREEIEYIESQTNRHNAVLMLQSEDLVKAKKAGWLDGFRFGGLNSLIIKFCDQMGMSERINNTVFPPAYHYFTRVFIWMFVIIITFSAADEVGLWAIPIGWLVGTIFHDTHTIGMTIIEPFKEGISGISLDEISRTIEINLLEMLGETDIPEPVKPVNDEYVT